MAEADRRIGEVERRLRTEMSEKSRSANRLIALLAAQRFEFERLVRRLGPSWSGATPVTSCRSWIYMLAPGI